MADTKRTPAKRTRSTKIKAEWEKDLPKKFRNPYIIFSAHVKEEQGAGMGLMQQSKMSAAKWGEISPDLKHEYEVASAREKLLYLWKVAEFKQNHPELYSEEVVLCNFIILPKFAHSDLRIMSECGRYIIWSFL